MLLSIYPNFFVIREDKSNSHKELLSLLIRLLINWPNDEFMYAVIFARGQIMMFPDNTKNGLTIFDEILLTQFHRCVSKRYSDN